MYKISVSAFCGNNYKDCKHYKYRYPENDYLCANLSGSTCVCKAAIKETQDFIGIFNVVKTMIGAEDIPPHFSKSIDDNFWELG